jgi:hypothetical protein
MENNKKYICDNCIYDTVKNPITFYHIFIENVSEMIGFLSY